MPEHVVFSNLIPSVFPCSFEEGCERSGDRCWGSLSPESNLGQGPSLHVHRGSANGLQVTGQKISDETESARLLLVSGEPAVSDSSCSRWWLSTQGVHKLRDDDSLNSFVGKTGSLAKETIPCRQSGQGIEPGGDDASEGMLLVEQRYKAHLMQSSCAQPTS